MLYKRWIYRNFWCNEHYFVTFILMLQNIYIFINDNYYNFQFAFCSNLIPFLHEALLFANELCMGGARNLKLGGNVGARTKA